MTTHREGIFVSGLWVEETPLKDVPQVNEVGLTSAPLLSMSFYYSQFCKQVNDDFMKCKNQTLDPKACLESGRRVTRCAISFIQQLKKECGDEFKNHHECLDVKNHHLWECRSQEVKLSDCVFEKFGIKKVIPDGHEQIHEKTSPYFK